MKTENCIFCKKNNEKSLYTGDNFYLIYDSYPVNKGHILIISKKHKMDYFTLNSAEKKELNQLIIKAREIIEKDNTPSGYNIGMNCGEDAGQTVMHFHCHLIPRYHGDMKDPRGGIRHCVEGKGYY
jgi:diadenosine tetraphosphate (Ap4A) HIT family hydrolase